MNSSRERAEETVAKLIEIGFKNQPYKILNHQPNQERPAMTRYKEFNIADNIKIEEEIKTYGLSGKNNTTLKVRLDDAIVLEGSQYNDPHSTQISIQDYQPCVAGAW